LLAAVIFAATVSGAPEFAAAMGSNNPTPPQSSKPSGSTTKQKTKKDKSSSAKDFLDRYHAAYALIYDKGDFGGGIPRYAPWAMTTMRTWQRCSVTRVASLAAMTTPNIGTTRRLPPIPITL